MRRLLNTYRWELWLFVGIPVVATLFVYIYDWTPAGRDDELRLYGWGAVTGAAAAATLKTASYRWVRQLGRPMLSVFWRFSLGASAVGALVFLIVNLLAPIPSGRTTDSSFTSLFVVLLVLAGVMSLMRLWFAREASRTSLAHAFLLVALTVGAGSISSVLSLREIDWGFLGPYGSGAVVGSVVVEVAIVFLSIWALAHFDGMGREGRRRAILAVLAISVLASIADIGVARDLEAGDYGRAWLNIAILSLPSVVFTLITLGLVYLIRVRHPTGPPPGATATTQSAAGHAVDVDYTDYH